MSRLIEWFGHNPVAANLLMWILVVGGLLALPRTHQEEFPNLEVDAVRISVPYLGAAPTEVESGVCIRIEEAIQGTEGIDKITSSASEGFCTVTAELVEGVDKTKLSNDIKSKVDAIDSFPAETEKPVTAEVTYVATVLQVALSGDADERTLKLLGQQLRDDLVALPAVSQVDLLFARPYEISIEVSEQTLRRYGLTLAAVGRAIEQTSLDIPGGSLKTEGGEILLRTRGQAYVGREFEDIVVLTRPDGTTVTLGEIADVVDGFEDSDLRARFDGQPALALKVSRVGEEDVLEIAQQVKDFLKVAQRELPEGIHLTVWQDESQDLVDRLDALAKNARSGLLLVLLVLTLFLRFRLALWVAAGIPVAMLGTVALFPWAGISISTMSVMAFILVLGILVDDAIVVAERVYSYEQEGMGQLAAAMAGAKDVSVPVMFGVLTTMATFIPIVNIPGPFGGFFAPLGWTVVLALLFSLVESQLILPSHLAHRRAEATIGGGGALQDRWLVLQAKISDSLQTVANRYYQPAVEHAIRWRYATLAIGVVVLAITLSLFASGRMTFQFFPAVEGTHLYAALTMPEGTPIEATSRAVARLEQAAEQMRVELDAGRDEEHGSIVNHVFSSIGSFIAKGSLGGGDSAQSNLAEIGIELNMPPGYEGEPASAMANRWRELTGGIPDAVELTFTSQAFGAGAAIEFELYGKKFDELRAAAAELRATLQGYNGVQDVTDSFRAGKQEVQLSLLPEARNLGLTLEDLGRQVRQAFYGYEAQRVQRGKDDIRVMVRFPEDERRSLGDLESMRIRTADGAEVPFSSVARATLARGYTTIRRVDSQRVVTVTADVDRNVTPPETVINAVVANELPAILSRHPGVTFSLAGESEERSKSLGSLGATTLLALLVIYALLAIPLQSYTQPLIIMSVIPFGAVGAILGHLILGMPLVFFSLLGIVALSGVVVNSSLVLVDYINRQRHTGQSLAWVVSHAGSVRFRPIVLTSITTFVGLAPMMLVKSISTSMFVPMAASLGFGVLMGTVVTLFLVPCLIMVLEDWMIFTGKHRAAAAADENSIYTGNEIA
ncbi:MAG: efflux RND transporter permease subunit [Gammaproteobacteria bacterium]|nr:efflux RND transporter permease subunit [Gammaproteobacteria bacterium]